MGPNSAAEHIADFWTGETAVRQRTAEYISFCETLRDRIAANDLPPDESYWWTRIALEEADRVESTRS